MQPWLAGAGERVSRLAWGHRCKSPAGCAIRSVPILRRRRSRVCLPALRATAS